MIASRLASSSVVQQPFVAGRVIEVHTQTPGGMERVAGTHQRGSYGLAIRSPLSVNFAGGAQGRAAIEHAAPRVTCLEGGGAPALCWRLLARPA